MRANAARQNSSLFCVSLFLNPVFRGVSVGSPDRRSFCSGLEVPPLYVCRSPVRFVHREPLLSVHSHSIERRVVHERRTQSNNKSFESQNSHFHSELLQSPTLSSCRVLPIHGCHPCLHYITVYMLYGRGGGGRSAATRGPLTWFHCMFDTMSKYVPALFIFQWSSDDVIVIERTIWKSILVLDRLQLWSGLFCP